MMTVADRSNVDRVLAQASQAIAAPAPPANDMGFSVQEAAALAQVAAQVLSLGKNPGKERYKQIDPQTDKLASLVGTDIVTGSAQIGVNPATVASHISFYLKERGIVLTPAQVLALAPSSSGALSTANLVKYLPYVALGVAAVYFMNKR